jgi:hypothetical protein
MALSGGGAQSRRLRDSIMMPHQASNSRFASFSFPSMHPAVEIRKLQRLPVSQRVRL